ncbi:retropepsin-like aspartic protease family protein [Pontibacter sp. JAM-7]|uniref:retropepsin-like aspartic protease family protein n=1 Tax=Pontibacter sp. JAM-7 TaxID=3366581 RepID=UPI003AF5D5A4
MQGQVPRKIGRGMWILTWVILLGLLYVYFDQYLADRHNPNRHLNANGHGEVVLQRNRAGHYIAPGTINGVAVRFLLDTGATSVSIPQQVAERIGLKRGTRYQVRTASGTADVYTTELDHIELGGISLDNIRAHINPHMAGDTVLLGMSFMQHLELVQKGDTLTLRY